MAASVDGVTEDDLEVAEILRCLPDMILSRTRTPFHLLRWGARRRRSGGYQGVLSSPASAPTEGKAAVVVDSPNTPLAFSGSEADAGERSPLHRKKRKKVGVSGSGSGSSQSTSACKQTYKDLKLMVHELSGENSSLLKEISQMHDYLQELQQLNSNLQSQARLQSNSSDSNPVEVESSPVAAIPPTEPVEPQPAVSSSSGSDDPSARPPENCNYVTGSGRNNNWFLLPDLNCTAEEAAASAVAAFESPYNGATNRANAAEARRRRIEINRSKNKLQRNR